MDLEAVIRTIPDFPKPGIAFRDITTLLQHPQAFRFAVDSLVQSALGARLDKVVGIEARGFILGGAVSHQLGLGFVPVRKKGKLPWKTIGQSYDLEYGTDTVEMHRDAIAVGERVLIIDDLLATGGTAEATIKLITAGGGVAVTCSFLAELPALRGRARLERLGAEVTSLVRFEDPPSRTAL